MEKIIKLAAYIPPTKEHPQPSIDVTASEVLRISTPSFWALELAGRSGVDMTDPDDVIPANYSTILAALLTCTAGMDAAFNPVRFWHPREVAIRLLPEEMAAYATVIADLTDELTAQIVARKGDSPNPPAAVKSRSTGGGKRSASPSTPTSSKG